VDVSGLAMSGLVPLSLVEDDFFVFDEARRNLTGRRTRKTIRLGDRVTVQVARVDTFKKQVDFCLVKEAPKPAARHAAPTSQPARPKSGREDRGRESRNQESRGRQNRAQPSRSPQNRSQDNRSQKNRGPASRGPEVKQEKLMFKTSVRPIGGQRRRR
jgi:ribonuclease R